MSNQTRMSLYPSFIQTITVGPGVPPDHVLRLRSALVGYTTDREFTCMLDGASVTLPRRFVFGCRDYISVCFDDAIDRANADALG